MIRAIPFIIFLILTNYTYAQNFETNPHFHKTKFWILGDSLGLEFNDTNVFKKSIHTPNESESFGIEIDSNGNLNFYIEPENVFSKDGKVLHELKGGNSARQGALIIPSTLDHHYFMFTATQGDGMQKKHITIHEYDAKNDTILNKKLILLNNSEGLAAINHQNQRNIIVVTHTNFNDEFNFFVVKENDLLCCPIEQHIGSDYSNGEFIKFVNGGNIVFTKDGTKLAITPVAVNRNANISNDLFAFDNELIQLSNHISFSSSCWLGNSFSSNGNVLYMTGNIIQQFDVSLMIKDSIEKSRKNISKIFDNSMNRIMRSINNKIYITYFDSSFLGVINNPNELGDNCGFVKEGFRLSKKYKSYGLPNFNASYFHTPSVDFAYTEDCWGYQYEFEGRDTLKATEWKWIFAKDNFRDSVATKHCNYTFPDTGKWSVSHIAITATRQDTITKTLTILPKFEKDFLGKDTFYCQGDSIKLTLRVPSNMHCVHWNNEEPNLDEELGAIRDYHHFHTDTLTIDTAGVYTVRITNKTFCQAWDTVTVIEAPLPAKPLISYETGALASTVIAKTYRWFLNGSFLLETEERSYKPISTGYYQLQLFSEYNCPSPLSDSFLVDTLVSIEKIEKEELFSIYPNPSDGNITIKAMQNIDYQVEVYDMLGKLILQKPNAKSIFISQKGSYVVTILCDGVVWSRVVLVE